MFPLLVKISLSAVQLLLFVLMASVHVCVLLFGVSYDTGPFLRLYIAAAGLNFRREIRLNARLVVVLFYVLTAKRVS